MSIKHGHCKGGVVTKTYHTWTSMKERCNNPNQKRYQYYGGRGVKVCERWGDFKNFYDDMGERLEGLTIERIDNNKGYFPQNCKWATIAEQRRNQHNTKLNPLKVQVIKKLLKESCLNQPEIGEIFNVSRAMINRIKMNQAWADIICPPQAQRQMARSG